MANAQALISHGLWKDQDFRRLPRTAQCTYVQLLSLRDLDCAGVLTLNLGVWAKGCDELTVDGIKADLDMLEQARFVVVDYDTDEALIRSYARLVSSRSPNAWKAAVKSAGMIASPKLRRVLAAELRRIDNRLDAAEVADRIDPDHTPSESHPNHIQMGSGGDQDAVRTPSERVNPIGMGFEGDSKPRRSVPVPDPVSPSVGGHLGGRPRCKKHPEGNAAEPCGACKAVREWDAAAEAARQADELAARRRLREIAEQCPICHGTAWVPDTDPAERCTHGMDSAEYGRLVEVAR